MELPEGFGASIKPNNAPGLKITKRLDQPLDEVELKEFINEELGVIEKHDGGYVDISSLNSLVQQANKITNQQKLAKMRSERAEDRATNARGYYHNLIDNPVEFKTEISRTAQVISRTASLGSIPIYTALKTNSLSADLVREYISKLKTKAKLLDVQIGPVSFIKLEKILLGAIAGKDADTKQHELYELVSQKMNDNKKQGSDF